MTRILAAVVLGATLILTTAAAFAESNSAVDREPSRLLIEQPAVVALDVAVSGDADQYHGPWYERRLDNIDTNGGF